MNESIDLTKILKYCCVGRMFWSPLYGEVKLCATRSRSVTVKASNGVFYDINADGTVSLDNLTTPEIMLYPSKDQRDWSKFTASWLKEERFDPKTLQPFDKVLVRDSDGSVWFCEFFSHILKQNAAYKYATISAPYRCCIPYNEETRHLVGTTDEAPEYYRYW